MIAGVIVLVVFMCVMATIYYDQVVIPWLRDKARFEIFAIRDELRMQVAEGDVEAISFPFQRLEHMLNLMASVCSIYSISNLLYAVVTTNLKAATFDERARFDAEASVQLKALEHRATSVMLSVLLKNSPFMCFVVTAAMLISAAWKQSIEMANRAFWHAKAVDQFGAILSRTPPNGTRSNGSLTLAR